MPIAVGGAAFLLGIGAVATMLAGEHNVHRGVYAALALAIGWGFTGTGLYVWRRSPGNHIGPLMIAVGFAGLVKALAFSNDSLVYTIGSLGEVLIWALLIHLLLSFPSGRLKGRVDRALVAIGYLNAIVVQLAAFVFTDTQSGCAACPANPLLITHSEVARVLTSAQVDIAIALQGAVVALLYLRWRDSTPGQRRAFTPILAAGGLTFVLLGTELLVEQADVSSTVADRMTVALFVSVACLPLAFLVGLLRARFGRAEDIATELTVRNEELNAQLRAKVAELRASRMRIVQAGDEQRRRIERNLHDGAQQRLMAVGINLRLVRDRIRDDPEGATELLDASLDELNGATTELRELARGIHPAVLTDRGLAAAIKGLAGRSPVPVELVEAPAGRLPPPVESAVYFVVAEALTNAARYAAADGVTVSVVRDNGHVEVEVADDGVGGADPDQGSGLRGLQDRVSALDGDLDLASASGTGTILRATIPCG